MGVLLLVRHGQASLGTADYDRLSDIGRRQAQVTGARLAGTDLTIDTDASSGGRLYASATGSVYITEFSGALNVLRATSANGDVTLWAAVPGASTRWARYTWARRRRWQADTALAVSRRCCSSRAASSSSAGRALPRTPS